MISTSSLQLITLQVSFRFSLLDYIQIWKFFNGKLKMNIGNAMAFAGIAAVKDRADLIAYLKTKSVAAE